MLGSKALLVALLTALGPAAASSPGGLAAGLAEPDCRVLLFGMGPADSAAAHEGSPGLGLLALDPVGRRAPSLPAALAGVGAGCLTTVVYDLLQPINQQLLWWAEVRRTFVVATGGNSSSLMLGPQHHQTLVLSFHPGSASWLLEAFCNEAGEARLANVRKGGQWRAPLVLDRVKSRLCYSGRTQLAGATLRVGAMENAGIVNTDVEGGSRVVGGVAVQLLGLLAQALDFKAEYHVENTLIYQNPDGSWGDGTLGKSATGEYDLAVDAPINSIFGAFGLYSTYSYTADYVCVVKKAGLVLPIRNIAFTFDSGTWIWLVISLLSVTLTFVLLAGCTQGHSKEQRVSEVYDMLLMPYGIVFQEYHIQCKEAESHSRVTNKGSLRMTWVLVALLLSMAYSGNLKASLIKKEYEDEPETIRDVLDADMTLYTMQTFVDYLGQTKSGLDNDMHAHILAKNSSYPPEGNFTWVYPQKTLDEDAALMQTKMFVDLRKSIYQTQGKAFPFSIIKEKWMTVYQGFFTRKGSPLPQILTPYVEKLTDHGFVSKAFSDAAPFKDLYQAEDDGDEEPLSLEYFYLLYAVWAIGLILSVVAFVVEKQAKGIRLRA